MQTFVDPRVEPASTTSKPLPRTTTQPQELTELHALSRGGRLYDVERWIASGRPLQVAQDTVNGRASSALQIALEGGNHALVLLLLSNGYDANANVDSPLDLALRSRRYDLLDLLLDWGADPHRVDLDDLFGTYNSELFERFRELGVDFAAGHALADAMAHHTSNKPLLGFAKRHRLTDRKFQRELDIALAHHSADGNEKGVQLCLWAGANQHALVPSLRFGTPSSDGDHFDEDDQVFLCSAIYSACQAGRDDILKRLGPDPNLDDFDELWRAAASPGVIDVLADHRLPTDAGPVVQHHLWWATFSEGWRRLEIVRRLFAVGVRWERSNPEEIGRLRRILLKASDNTFVELMRMLALGNHCSPEILRELGRTPSMLDRMKKVGFIQANDARAHSGYRPTHSREVLKSFGIQPPAPKRPVLAVPRSVRIGRPAQDAVELDREELFARVWSRPVATIAKECGISGTALKKICTRLHVPVPPRGYWAKLNAGKHVRRSRLPALPSRQTNGDENS